MTCAAATKALPVKGYFKTTSAVCGSPVEGFIKRIAIPGTEWTDFFPLFPLLLYNNWSDKHENWMEIIIYEPDNKLMDKQRDK